MIFSADNESNPGGIGGGAPHVNLTGGPLSYRYRFQEIHIHYGLHDQFGSEHSVGGYSFPAEVSNNCINFRNSFRYFILRILMAIIWQNRKLNNFIRYFAIQNYILIHNWFWESVKTGVTLVNFDNNEFSYYFIKY